MKDPSWTSTSQYSPAAMVLFKFSRLPALFLVFYSLSDVGLPPGVAGLIQFLQEPSSVTVPLAQPLWWHCSGRLVEASDVTLSYTWLRGGNPLDSNSNTETFPNGTLHIRAVGADDAGPYLCRAQGGGEIDYTDAAILSIATLGSSFALDPISRSITLGNPLSLECSIVSNPTATVSWQRNGSPVQESDAIIATGAVDTETRSSLHVASVDHQHGGQYRCLATNELLDGQTRFSEPATVTLIGRPGFSTPPSPQVAVVGSSVTFQCSTTGSPMATIAWLDADDAVIQDSQHFLVSPGSLRINDVQLKDSGYYTCRATNEYGENTASALLTVAASYRPVAFTQPPMDQTVEVGGRVIFACEADGVPPPTITWTKDGGSIAVGRTDEPVPGRLRITDVQTPDSGFYVCTATNGLSTDSQTAQLIIQEQPHFTTVPEATTVLVDEAVLLNCLAEGRPEPEISWTTPLTALGILQMPSQPTPTLEVASNGSLILSTVRREHAGIYTCTASNTVGIVSTEARVTVHGPPVITRTPSDVTAIEGAVVMLSCRATGVPAVQSITWTFGSELLETSLRYEVFDNGDLRIVNIGEAQEGTYTCQAVNAVGPSPTVSAHVTVHVSPAVEVRPVGLTYDLGSNVTLFCEATGDPTPVLEWLKDGMSLVLADNVVVLTNFSLVIVGLERDNTGSYQCMATNDAGVAQASTTVMTPDIPEIISTDGNVTVNQTQVGVLPCRAHARERPSILWYLSDPMGVRGDGIGRGENLPGTRGYQSSITEEGDLVIGAVSTEDKGWYLCRATNSVGSVTQLIYMSVNYPALIESTNVRLTGSGGSSRAILTCEVDGHPLPSVTWYLPSGEPVVPTDDSGRYFINHINASSFLVVNPPEVRLHDGDFRCEAENILGSDVAAITVTIQGIPVIVSVSADVSTSSVMLRCFSKGAPTPQISWARDGSFANLIPGHSVLVDGALIVSDFGAALRGRYVCHLQNRHGVVSAALQAPSRPSRPEVGAITSRDVKLSWDPPVPNSNLSVDSYEVRYWQLWMNTSAVRTGIRETTGVTLQGLSPYTPHQFEVRARNGLGAGDFSDPSVMIFTSEDDFVMIDNVTEGQSRVRLQWSAFTVRQNPDHLSWFVLKFRAAPTVPDAVGGFTLKSVGNSILVSWDEPVALHGNREHIVYDLVYGPITESTSGHVTFTKAHDGIALQLLPDLEPATEYQVALRVRNTFLGAWSNEVIGQIQTGYPAPVSVLRNVRAVSNSSDSIVVTWKAVSVAAFIRYIISYRESASGSSFPDISVNDTGAMQHIITGLAPGTAYAVRMSYETEGGIAPYSPEFIVRTDEDLSVSQQAQRGPIGFIVGGIFGVLVLILVALLMALIYVRCRRTKDKFEPSPAFDPDSLWINRRFSYGDTISLDSTVDDGSFVKKGSYEVSAVVNRNYEPSDTLASNDSEYDLAARDVAGASGGGPAAAANPGKQAGGRRKKRKSNDDVIYKDPLNPEVVLVKKAVLGDESPPKILLNDHEISFEDDHTANSTAELIASDLDTSGHSAFPTFPDAGHDQGRRTVGGPIRDDYPVLKENTRQEKLNKKARRERKRQENADQQLRDREFDSGYQKKASVAGMFNVKGVFSRRKASVEVDIPRLEANEADNSGTRSPGLGDSAVLY